MDRTEFKKAAELVGYLKRLKVIFPIGFPYTGKLGASTPEYKRQLFDELVEHYNALKKLEEPSLYWDIKNELQGEFISAVTDRSPENVSNTIELIRKWFDLRVYKDPYHEKIYELPFFLDLIDNGIATEDEVLLLSLHMEVEIMYRNRLCEEIKEAYTSLWPEKVQADEKPAKETLHTKVIPSVLDTDEARKYFDKAREIGLMDDNYDWLAGKEMLACFAYSMSKELSLGKGERISWRPFEVLFRVPFGKLRGNYNDVQKTGDEPQDIWKVNEVFKK